jgi:PiT family inorganic phosphate transporter
MAAWPLIIVAATLFVAYANGANDNFKGVATLFGSGLAEYRKSLIWATVTTIAGSVTALFLAGTLVSIFQGKGLLPAGLAQSQPFLAAGISGAALTVLLATKLGMPISTTHALTGSLLGAGMVAAGMELGFQTLLGKFFAPLLISPLVALSAAAVGYPLFSGLLQSLGVNRESCVCVAESDMGLVAAPQGALFVETTPGLRVIVESAAACARPAEGIKFGVNVEKALDAGHFISAGAVSFARGLNDTPKIVALGLAVSVIDFNWSIFLVAATMALGGLVHSRKIADTVSKRITGMDADHGFVANLVTSILVICASRWGLPVSTTHVSCGALFGIGIANGQARWGMIRTILVAWVLTLPTAALSSAGILLTFQTVT